jgi:hypothetical protein
MLSEPGYLYAAYSRYCDWIKIGFTSKTGRQRLEAVDHQYPLFAPFTLIGSVPSLWRAEQQIHAFMEPFRQRHTAATRELYPATLTVVQVVKLIIAGRDRPPFTADQMREMRAWCRDRARHPLNQDEALQAFARFYAERKAA